MSENEMRLELLELADALEALNRWWPLPSTRRWAKRLVKRTRERHEAAWRDSVADVFKFAAGASPKGETDG